jgi:hypothetical protein
MDSTLPIFYTNTLRIVCISDTHNDNPVNAVPDGDVFIHAGDMTDHGTIPEYTAVLNWVQMLPHKVKILIAGNRDASLDTGSDEAAHMRDPKKNGRGNRFNPDALSLMTSLELRAKGIHYLDCETRTVAYYTVPGSTELHKLSIYGNPLQPEFSLNRWPFTYPSHSTPEAEEAWLTAPTEADSVPIWVMHSPPLDRLDKPHVAGLSGCAVEAQRIEMAKPKLCVFGHFHYSWGVERVKWNKEGRGIANAQILTLSEERKKEEKLEGPMTRTDFNFSSDVAEETVKAGEETLFVNAAWMTSKKTEVEDRNMPIVVTLTL